MAEVNKNIDLRPPEIVKKYCDLQIFYISIIIIILLICLLSVWSCSLAMTNQGLRNNLKELEVIIGDFNTLEDKALVMDSNRSENKISYKISHIELLLSKQSKWSDILTDIWLVKPNQLIIDEYRVTYSEMILRGKGETVSSIMNFKRDLVDKVSFSQIEIISIEYRENNYYFHITGEVPINLN